MGRNGVDTVMSRGLSSVKAGSSHPQLEHRPSSRLKLNRGHSSFGDAVASLKELWTLILPWVSRILEECSLFNNYSIITDLKAYL